MEETDELRTFIEADDRFPSASESWEQLGCVRSSLIEPVITPAMTFFECRQSG